jgi:hypothetical protein
MIRKLLTAAVLSLGLLPSFAAASPPTICPTLNNPCSVPRVPMVIWGANSSLNNIGNRRIYTVYVRTCCSSPWERLTTFPDRYMADQAVQIYRGIGYDAFVR